MGDAGALRRERKAGRDGVRRRHARIWDDDRQAAPGLRRRGRHRPRARALARRDASRHRQHQQHRAPLAGRRRPADRAPRPRAGKVITYAVFSPDGARLATASSDTARVWDGRSGKFLFELRGHTDAVTGRVQPARRPDRDRLRRCDRAVWDMNGRPLSDYRGHRAWLTSVTFSTDGRRLATGSADDTAKVWTRRSAPARARTPGHGRRERIVQPGLAFVVTGGVPGGVERCDRASPPRSCPVELRRSRRTAASSPSSRHWARWRCTTRARGA